MAEGQDLFWTRFRVIRSELIRKLEADWYDRAVDLAKRWRALCRAPRLIKPRRKNSQTLRKHYVMSPGRSLRRNRFQKNWSARRSAWGELLDQSRSSAGVHHVHIAACAFDNVRATLTLTEQHVTLLAGSRAASRFRLNTRAADPGCHRRYRSCLPHF